MQSNSIRTFIFLRCTIKMAKIILVLICALIFSTPSFSKEKVIPMEYELTGTGQPGMQGTYIVQVYVYYPSQKPDDSYLSKCAVHGVLFRGYSSPVGGRQQSQKPLAGSPIAEQQHADFFNAFFKDGIYMNYVEVVSSSRTVVKLDKKRYKVGTIVMVKKDLLRKTLEAAGIVKALNSYF